MIKKRVNEVEILVADNYSELCSYVVKLILERVKKRKLNLPQLRRKVQPG